MTLKIYPLINVNNQFIKLTIKIVTVRIKNIAMRINQRKKLFGVDK